MLPRVLVSKVAKILNAEGDYAWFQSVFGHMDVVPLVLLTN